MTIPSLSEAMIRAHSSGDSFSRGRSYYDQGAVDALARRGNTLQGQVEGSQYAPYQVRVTLDDGGIRAASCTCPYVSGGWCKHIIAVLLSCLYAPANIESRPTLETLLSGLDRDQMQALLLAMGAGDPEFADSIERQLGLLRLAESRPQSRRDAPARRTTVDPQPIRQQVRALVRASGRGRYGEYTDSGAVVSGIGELLRQARQFIEGDDARNAMVLLETLTEEYLESYEDMYDDEGEAAMPFSDLGEAWTEAVLSADLSATERRTWAKRFGDWARALDDYDSGEMFQMAQFAAEHGWDAPALQRVLQGEITEQGAWDSEPPTYSDELALIRLAILERQGRHQEYLYLAEAEGQLDRYLVMLAKLGRVQEAVDEGLKFLSSPDEALKLARTLRERGELVAAVQIAEHGLAMETPSTPFDTYTLPANRNKGALAAWLSDLAAAMGDSERALHAAEIAFRAAPSLNAYLKVQELAGERWADLHTELLDYLRGLQTYMRDAKVDVFLHEGLIDDAITAVKDGGYYGLLERVMDAALTTRPNWVIKAATAQAEQIMDAGKAQHYDHAVGWLRRARDSYRASGRQADWRDYLSGIRAKHGRKHKLMGLLQQL